MVRMYKRVTKFPARAAGPADRLAGFMAHLRMNGFKIGVQETGAALAALGAVNAWDETEARRALKAVCTGCAQDFGRFDELFAAYWQNLGHERAGQARARETVERRWSSQHQDQGATGSGRAEQPDSDGDGEADQDGEGRLVGSRMRNMMRVDLREMVSSADISQAEAVAERLARAIRDRRSRRQRLDKQGSRLDLRRVIRASLSSGGEPIRLFHRTRPDRPSKLVAILDVSGSMVVYARVFLAFVKGLMTADGQTDAYLFHTRLVRITEALRDRDALRAVNRLSLLAQGFGGGTKIGGNLAAFNKGYAKRLVGARSVVMILSDGFDTDPPQVLGAALADLKKRGCRVIWLNPLKGWQGYAPVAAGMAAALPYLDMFAAANTLESLAALEPELARL